MDWSVMTMSRVCVNGDFRTLGQVGGETTLLDAEDLVLCSVAAALLQSIQAPVEVAP